MSDWRLGFNGENKNEFDFKSFFVFFFLCFRQSALDLMGVMSFLRQVHPG